MGVQEKKNKKEEQADKIAEVKQQVLDKWPASAVVVNLHRPSQEHLNVGEDIRFEEQQCNEMVRELLEMEGLDRCDLANGDQVMTIQSATKVSDDNMSATIVFWITANDKKICKQAKECISDFVKAAQDNSYELTPHMDCIVL